MTNDTARLDRLAGRLRELHQIGNPLLLINAWDGPSAKAVEAAGAVAIATSSAAVAETRSAQDNNTAGKVAFDVLRQITDLASVPVTADLEGGYGLSGPDLVAALLDAGAVGCNIEDTNHGNVGTLLDAERHATYLRQIRTAATAAGVSVVINARIDTILHHPQRDARAVIKETVRRAQLYMAAGVDCVYPIGLRDPSVVRELVDALRCPVNVNPGPPMAALAEAGAARISTGAGTYRFMTAELERRARLMFEGDPEAFA